MGRTAGIFIYTRPEEKTLKEKDRWVDIQGHNLRAF